MGAVRAGIIAHRFRYIVYFVDARQHPAAVFSHRRKADQREAVEPIERHFHSSSSSRRVPDAPAPVGSLSAQRACSKAKARQVTRAGGTKSNKKPGMNQKRDVTPRLTRTS